MFQNLVFRCKDAKRQRREAIINNKYCCNFTKIVINENSLPSCHPAFCSSDFTHPFTSPPLKGGEKECSPQPSPIGEGAALPRNDNFSSRFTLHSSLKKRVAFTLAEVLITLGIIGVVAAMTIPSLINNYQKKQTVTKLKQTYSIISQALTMAQAEHGDSTTWELAGIYGTPTGDSNFSSKEALETFVKKYFVPYLKVSKDYGYTTRNAIKYDGPKLPTDGNLTSGANSYKYFLQLPSNVLISILIGTSGCSEGTSVADGTCVDKYLNPDFIVDINGFQGPNKLGKDVFVMTFNLHSRIFEFYKYESNKQSALKNCKSGTFYTCGYFILLDGWEIKEDYPW